MANNRKNIALKGDLTDGSSEGIPTIEKSVVDLPSVPKNAPRSDILFEVNGLKIRSNSVYQVVGLNDDTAPEAFKQFGTSKLPNPDIGELKMCHFDTVTNTYDTGLFAGSACYRGVSPEEAKMQVSLREKYILKPYEHIIGAGKLDHNNLDFWDNYSAFLKEGKAFFTSDISQLFELYVLIQSKNIIPKHLEGSPEYPNAMYCIEDQKQVVDIGQKRTEDKMEAISVFNGLIEDDNERLLYVLQWIKLDVEGFDARSIKTMFWEFIEDPKHLYRAEIFLSTSKGSYEEKTYETLRIFYKLNLLLKRNRLTKSPTGYVIEGYDLGLNLNDAAQNLVNNPSMADAKIRVLQLTER